MTTMTRTVTQEWTDGIALVCREGRTVTVQILGDVYVTTYTDDDEAQIAFAAEVAQELDASAAVRSIAGDDDEDGDEW